MASPQVHLSTLSPYPCCTLLEIGIQAKRQIRFHETISGVNVLVNISVWVMEPWHRRSIDSMRLSVPCQYIRRNASRGVSRFGTKIVGVSSASASTPESIVLDADTSPFRDDPAMTTLLRVMKFPKPPPLKPYVWRDSTEVRSYGVPFDPRGSSGQLVPGSGT
jgi:hypothetical protein